VRFFAVGVQPVGVIAVGVLPTGLIAVGQVSTGVIAVGQVARGFVAVGQLALGFMSFGQLAVGVLWAGGQLAVGGTAGVAMLPLGLFGRWNPWRGSADLRPMEPTSAGFLKVLAFAAIVGLFVYLAAGPVVDAIVRPDGIFRPPTPMR
jgi:hypothetical protein